MTKIIYKINKQICIFSLRVNTLRIIVYLYIDWRKVIVLQVYPHHTNLLLVYIVFEA